MKQTVRRRAVHGLPKRAARLFPKWALHLLPKRTLTSVAGALARHPVSRFGIPWYIRHYGVNLEDAELGAERYETLAALFTRRLKPGARPVYPSGIVSPVDGTVGAIGPIRDGQLLQAKGSLYTVAALLADGEDARRFAGGEFVTVYLSPRDYHRIHMPVDGKISAWRYVPGNLFPVNPAGVRHIPGVFTRNERLVTHIETAFGSLRMVKVGATIVGSIRTPYGPRPCRAWDRERRRVQQGLADLELPRGAEVGWFDFGSTVILLFEPGMIRSWRIGCGEAVRVGQLIADTFH